MTAKRGLATKFFTEGFPCGLIPKHNMGRSTRQKSKAQNSLKTETVNSYDETGAGPDIFQVDQSATVSARKLLKRRLYGRDVPADFWLSFGLENQKKFVFV